MMKKYLCLILTAVMVILILLGLPRRKGFRLPADDLLERMARQTHIVSIHKIKEMLALDLYLCLVDLREAGEFEEGHLPDALNLSPESRSPNAIHRFFRKKASGWVLYAARTYEAERYWMLFTQMGIENLYVLETDPGLDTLILTWDMEGSRMIRVDEMPRYTFLPDTTLSF
jgi:rhodanese-related sulfurtransferase